MIRRTRLILAAAALAALVCAPAAIAAWSSSGSGSASAKARAMPAGNTPTTSRSNRNVTVSWAQSSFSGGPAVSGYVVRRYTSAGVLQSIGSACNTTIAGLTCTESAVPAGTWRYSVTPQQGLWSGTESARSVAVTVPAASLTLSSTLVPTVPATLTGTIANFVPGQTVTYRLDNATSGTVLSGSITPSPVPASGTASVSVTLPAGTTAGSHTIYAIGSAGDVASRAVTVGPTFVKNVGSSSCGATSAAVTVPAAGVAAQNTLILRLALRGTTAAAVAATDSGGNTYTVDRDVLNGNQRAVVLHGRVTTALTSGNTITVNFPSSTGAGLVADEFSNVAAGAADASGAGTGTSAAPSAPVTTTNASDLLIGAVSASGALTAGQPSGFTALTAQSLACGPLTNVGGRRLVTTTGAFSYSPTLSASGTWAAALVAYKAG